MSDIGQLPLQQQPHLTGTAFWRRKRGDRHWKVSCMTLYAMHLASGVPVELERGTCPVCGSRRCKLARALEQRG
jgi:hypothetical protein